MKNLIIGLLLSAAAPRDELLQGLRGSKHPSNLSVEAFEMCSTAVTRAKKGPALWEDIIAKGEKYTDNSFGGRSSLYWGISLDFTAMKEWEDGLWHGTYEWQRLGDLYPSASLWDTNPHFVDSVQGGAGNCYFMASISAVAEFPDLIKDAFLTKTVNDAGIYALRFYIRGKPWIITVDDELLTEDNKLVFGNVGPNTHLWGPIMDKAWAKIEGSYTSAGSGGYFTTGIRSLMNAPVFHYDNSAADGNAQAVWQQIKDANSLNYIIGAGIGSGTDSELNSYGVTMGHQYAILDAFTLTDGGGTVQHRMLMIRNPYGDSYYSGPWSHDDSKWTTAYIAQVPLGIDPTMANQKGIFFVEDTDFLKALDDYQIAHYRGADGYSLDIYDQDMDLNFYKTLYVDLPAHDGDLYFNVESYYLNMVPTSCLLGMNPEVSFQVFIGDDLHTEKKYKDEYPQPIMVPASDYKASDKIKLVIAYSWYIFPLLARDYTVSLYSSLDTTIVDSDGKPNVCIMDGTFPSCFTESSYHISGTSAISENDTIPQSLSEVFLWSYNWDSFWQILSSNWWTLLWWF